MFPRTPCHPGQSHLASPVGDDNYPCPVFPTAPKLKRSLAYTPRVTGLPRSSIAAWARYSWRCRA